MDIETSRVVRLVRTECRACSSNNLFVAIDLGQQPLAGGFVDRDAQVPTYENKMLMCSDCGLGQLSFDVSPEDLYSSYNWRTSTSASYLDYIWKFADEHIIPNLEKDDWVLEIASNDGYLLKYLQDKNVDVLGVDPAKNISLYAIASGVPVIVDFFSSDVAKKILELKGYPKWIVANNVAAHTPDIKSFIEGIAILSGEDTIVTIENPTVMNILNHDHFDVIFHEHYSYLSTKSVINLAAQFGMTLFNIERTPPQGGSNRYWLSKSKTTQSSVPEFLLKEIEEGLLNPDAWESKFTDLQAKAKTFYSGIEELAAKGRIVCGMGASAKSTVTLNFAGIRPLMISAIADDVKEKQGFYVPTAGIPIVSTKEMLALNPTDVIIFAWNLKAELTAKLKALGYQGNVWVWGDHIA